MAELNSEKLITQYLLGELPEEQQIEIEDRAFGDKEFLANITAVENDLIDEYVREELPETARRRFETRFLASEGRRKRVEFARALTQLTDESRVAEQRTVTATPVSWRDALAAFINGLNHVAKIALAAATLLILIGGAWLITQTLTLRNQLRQLQAQQQSQQSDRQTLERQVEGERRRSEELAARLDQEKQQRAQTDESLRRLSEQTPETPRSIIASLTLLPGIGRGASTRPKLVVPADATVAQLQIGIEQEETYKSFSVDLRTVDGRAVWNRDSLPARSTRGGRSIRLTLPATVLKPGEYELRLKGKTPTDVVEDVGFYYFEVLKR